ncbi:hypothetical protein M0R45_026142 [Rubus argutus]|uniref:Uncharacterized protein n=1 Tax=Rubus argutus TaxID=59490 RepID=A0AAW1WWP6_RUBAR
MLNFLTAAALDPIAEPSLLKCRLYSPVRPEPSQRLSLHRPLPPSSPCSPALANSQATTGPHDPRLHHAQPWASLSDHHGLPWHPSLQHKTHAKSVAATPRSRLFLPPSPSTSTCTVAAASIDNLSCSVVMI